jgi:flagellar motor switch protein FliG
MRNALKIPSLAALFGFAAAAAQAPVPAARPAQDQAAKLTQYYENLATRTLARYYEEATFLVKAKVEVEPPPEIELGGGDDALPADAPQQLPGLPFLPDNAQPEKPAPAKDAQKGGGIQAVAFDVLVDTGYTEKDAEFIRNLLAMTARLDDARGDRVSVHEGVFPRDNHALASYRKPPEPPPSAAPQPKPAGRANADSADGRKAEAKDKAPANPFAQYLDHLPSLIPLLLICLLILACVWMVSRAIVGAARAERKPAEPAPPPPPAPVPAPAPKPAEANGKNPELAAFRPFLLNCFVGNPKHCGQILKSWIQRDPDRGMRDAAALVASLDARLMGVIGPELGKETTAKLEVHLAAGEPATPEELLNVYKEFKREYGNLESAGAESDQYKDLFGFLRQMNEQQIMHILRDESLGIAGLVLAQLPGETASGILQKTDPENRGKLLIAMGNIDHIPLNVYKEIADRLSLKALEVGNMRYVAADGVDSILELIDSLPLSLQFQYIHSISEMDLGLGEKLRNRYVTLPELVGLPDKFLSNVLQGLDQETLILALAHVDDAVKGKILSLLPERMQMLVASGLEAAVDKAPKDSEAAQRRLLRKIREEIRHSGRPA